MRNLHTHINVSSQLVDLPPIGRGQDPNPLDPYQAADQQLAEKKAPSSYSIRTKWGQMDENLALAKGFVGKQISNLREINKTIDIWSSESSRGSHCTGQIAHVMGHVSYSDEAATDIVVPNRTMLDSWTLVGVTAGVASDQWSAELYIDNLFDKRAEILFLGSYEVSSGSYMY